MPLCNGSRAYIAFVFHDVFTAIRRPRGKGSKDGRLHQTTALHLSTEMLNAIKTRNDFDTSEIEDVIWGNVTQVGEQGAKSEALAK